MSDDDDPATIPAGLLKGMKGAQLFSTLLKLGLPWSLIEVLRSAGFYSFGLALDMVHKEFGSLADLVTAKPDHSDKQRPATKKLLAKIRSLPNRGDYLVIEHLAGVWALTDDEVKTRLKIITKIRRAIRDGQDELRGEAANPGGHDSVRVLDRFLVVIDTMLRGAEISIEGSHGKFVYIEGKQVALTSETTYTHVLVLLKKLGITDREQSEILTDLGFSWEKAKPTRLRIERVGLRKQGQLKG